jgi:hypothetical protein
MKADLVTLSGSAKQAPAPASGGAGAYLKDEEKSGTSLKEKSHS